MYICGVIGKQRVRATQPKGHQTTKMHFPLTRSLVYLVHWPRLKGITQRAKGNLNYHKQTPRKWRGRPIFHSFYTGLNKLKTLSTRSHLHRRTFAAFLLTNYFAPLNCCALLLSIHVTIDLGSDTGQLDNVIGYYIPHTINGPLKFPRQV